jgi:cytochrome d ubiquinol oxidase subunit II
MMNTVAPVWDGNETWLVLGGGGLLAAFPLAYSILLPALYLPILLMLIGLILRGVAFEFRFRGRDLGRRGWGAAFALGSFVAAFSQGLVLGGFIQGVGLNAAETAFAGGAFDWLTPYTLLVAVGVVAGYALLGAGWIVLKSEDELHGQGRRWVGAAAVATALLLAGVSLATIFIHPQVAARWGVADGGVDLARFLPRAPAPLLGAAGFGLIAWGLRRKSHALPFAGALLVFLSGYIGLAIGFAPYVVPYQLDFREAAAPDNALALMLGGTAVALPLILGYTAYVYWVFRGKVAPDAHYH